MTSTFTPARYPEWHEQAGKIIVNPDDDALAQMDAMPTPEPTSRLTPPAGSRFSRPAAPAEPAAPPAEPPTSRFATPVAPGERRALADSGAPGAPGRSAVSQQRLTVAAGALALLALLALASALPRFFGGTPTPAPVPTVAPVATMTPAATSEPAVTALPPDAAPRALVAYFDYQDAGSAVAIENGVRYQIVGRAGSRWLLITTEAGARVWALAEDLGVTVDPDLPDLSPPPPPAPVAPARPAAPAAPVLCTDATAPFRATIEVPPGPKPSDIGGIAGGWSCVSQEDALAKAEQNAASIRAKWSTP